MRIRQILDSFELIGLLTGSGGFRSPDNMLFAAASFGETAYFL